jgi:hypothetical protein
MPTVPCAGVVRNHLVDEGEGIAVQEFVDLFRRKDRLDTRGESGNDSWRPRVWSE